MRVGAESLCVHGDSPSAVAVAVAVALARAAGRARDGEPASEPMVVGAMQVPPDGRPALFLADHPVTGGTR
ncbi:hypothetical protein GCM10009838_03940 [Catenulispora subtropica]|uniref:Carboxyltransferase domain-containing protein n=1 Tax=Catenulispora subtropica TaxID=450798 RepID=A0ABP5BV79_9ACTN